MPLTESKTRLRLPFRRAYAAGFWSMISVLIAFAVAGSAYAAGSRAPWAWALSAVAGALLPGIVWNPWYMTGIRVWNGVVRRLRAVLRAYALNVCYWTVVIVVSRAGSRLETPRSRTKEGSGWEPTPLQIAASSHGFRAAMQRPGNRWLFAMVPVVWLLELLSDDVEVHAPPGSIYTLF